MAEINAGWYPDGSGLQRYWDGTAWTEHTAQLDPQPAAVLATVGVPVAQVAPQLAPGPALASAPATAAPISVPNSGSNGLATAGFVLGLLGFLGSWIPLLNIVSGLIAVIGVVLAGVGLAKSTKVGAGKGLAIAGLVLGVLAVIIAIVINAAFVNSVDDAVDDVTRTEVVVPVAPGNSSASSAPVASGEAAAELGTTRDSPVPIGSAINSDDWTLKVNSVKTVNVDSLGRSAAAGKTLLSINLTATYNGDDEQGDSVTFAGVKFVASDGTTVDPTDGFFIADDSFDSLKTLFNGASETGDEILEVPDGWNSGVLAVSLGLFKDDVFVAVQ